MAPDQSLEWLISVDDHVLEPAHLWVDRVAAKDRERAPHMAAEGDMEFWVYDGKRYPSSGLSAVAGKSKEFSPEPVTYAVMRPGCDDAKARIEDMDRAGILASLCFPTVTRFCGQLFMDASDRVFGFECLKASNDWMLEEWCQAVPGRYIPLILIPMWDPGLAANEMERCAQKGATAFAFSENPAPLGLPTIHDEDGYWDPVMSTASERQPLVGAYRTEDGRHIQLVFLEADRYWSNFCRLLGRDDLIEDPRYATLQARRENAEACMHMLDEEFGRRTFAEWKELLGSFDAPWAPVQSVLELLDDPQVLANGYVGEVEIGSDISYRLPAVPVQFDGASAGVRRAPEHGEQTESVLLELGYGWDDIASLRDKGAIP